MKTTKINRTVTVKPGNTQWNVHQLFGKLAATLDTLPDADEVRRNPLRSAPAGMPGMVF